MKLKTFVAAIGAATALMAGAASARVDANLPAYKTATGVSGNFSSVGSDTLNNLMTLWAEDFKRVYPNVNIQIEGKGSSTAPPALISGTSQLGPMSRKMKDKEIEEFEKKFGYKPTAIGVALDSLAVYVNKDNPIEKLSLEQVDAIFSETRKREYPNDIKTWGQVGLKGQWAKKPISLYGRNSASGTYGYFKEHTLDKGDYKASVKEQPGSASVVLGVTEELGAIGYSGIGYKTSGVKALALSQKGGEYYEPTYDNVLAGKYPLGRMLYVYVAKEPNKPMDKLTAEFLKFVLSKEGQEIVIKDGYLPMTASLVKQQLANVQ